jgi:hypothetical protein
VHPTRASICAGLVRHESSPRAEDFASKADDKDRREILRSAARHPPRQAGGGKAPAASHCGGHAAGKLRMTTKGTRTKNLPLLYLPRLPRGPLTGDFASKPTICASVGFFDSVASHFIARGICGNWPVVQKWTGCGKSLRRQVVYLGSRRAREIMQKAVPSPAARTGHPKNLLSR